MKVVSYKATFFVILNPFRGIERRLIMTHTKRVASVMLMLIMLVSLFPSQVFAAKQNGWWQDSTGHWYYFVDGQEVKGGWKKIGGKWYCFGNDAIMLSNTFIPEKSGNKHGVDFYYLDTRAARW